MVGQTIRQARHDLHKSWYYFCHASRVCAREWRDRGRVYSVSHLCVCNTASLTLIAPPPAPSPSRVEKSAALPPTLTASMVQLRHDLVLEYLEALVDQWHALTNLSYAYVLGGAATHAYVLRVQALLARLRGTLAYLHAMIEGWMGEVEFVEELDALGGVVLERVEEVSAMLAEEGQAFG
jgi:hypothetical protein